MRSRGSSLARVRSKIKSKSPPCRKTRDKGGAPSHTKLDQAGANATEEVFAVGFRLGEDFWLVAVLEGDLLEEEFYRVFGLEALGDELADARGEAVGIVGGTEAGEVVGAAMILKFCGGQAVKGGFGFRIVEQRGQRAVPFALGTGPSAERMAGGPD